MTTPAFSYLRVSSPSSVELDGFTRQRETIARYANQNNIEIVEEFRDEGVSGKTELANRPGLGSLLARLETNGVKLVLVEISDRIARDLVVNELIIREFQKIGVRVISASGGVDLTAGNDDNPTAKLIRQILAAVAEFDRAIIVLKTKAARDRIRKEKGKCEGRRKFGEWPGEDTVLQLIFNLTAKGWTASRIAGELNETGIRNRYQTRWNSGTIWKIVNRTSRTSKTGSSQSS